MTLTEALKQGNLVRRKSWPWWKCYNNIEQDANRIWAIKERPVFNGWQSTILWTDAIAEDWVIMEETP